MSNPASTQPQDQQETPKNDKSSEKPASSQTAIPVLSSYDEDKLSSKKKELEENTSKMFQYLQDYIQSEFQGSNISFL
jgi:hypothetical protein